MNIEDIDKLLEKEINGTISEEEKKALNHWLKKSLSDNWQPNVDAAWDKVSKQIKTKQSTSKGLSIKFFPWISIAAIFIIGVFLTIQFINSNKTEVDLKAENSILSHELSDGTKIVLSHKGRLIFKESSKERKVSLTGVAHFDVAPNKNKPFIISAHKNKILVVGTKFDVEALDNYFSVQVYEGIVEVSTETSTEKLYPGDIIEIKNEIISHRKSEEQGPRWTKNELVFIDQPLNSVIKDLERFYGKEIILEDTAENCIVSTGFSKETFDEAIKELQQLLRFEVKTINGTTIIYNLNCK